VSVKRRHCIKTAAWIELIFLHTAFLNVCYAVFVKNWGYLQNKGSPLWNFVPNSGLEKFRHGTPTVGECDINSDSGRSGIDSTWRRRVDGTRAWHVRTVRSTVDDRSPTVDSSTWRAALCTAQWFRYFYAVSCGRSSAAEQGDGAWG